MQSTISGQYTLKHTQRGNNFQRFEFNWNCLEYETFVTYFRYNYFHQMLCQTAHHLLAFHKKKELSTVAQAC